MLWCHRYCINDAKSKPYDVLVMMADVSSDLKCSHSFVENDVFARGLYSVREEELGESQSGNPLIYNVAKTTCHIIKYNALSILIQINFWIVNAKLKFVV